jgi:hypothetical protein
MDFSGDTIVDAKNRLWSFVEQACEGLGIALQQDGGIHTDLNATSVRLTAPAGGSFYLETNVVDEAVARTQSPDPEKNLFGGGHILKRGAHIMLELRQDDDHLYRWWGAPLLIDAEVMSVIPTDGRPFVLTQEYVADGLKSLHETSR